MKRVAIIGGGASGITAGIFASRKGDTSVTIYESGTRPLKKLLATGNGRCNFSNANLSPAKYNNPEFVEQALTSFSYKDSLNFFQNLGLMYTKDDEGRLYPYSLKATTISDILLGESTRLKIKIRLGEEVTGIYKNENRFEVATSRGDIQVYDSLIISSGSSASYKNCEIGFLNTLEIPITKLTPALAPLITHNNAVKGLKGIRVKAQVTASLEGGSIHTEYGEVLFRDNGLSGIVIFNTSLMLARKQIHKCEIALDLLPNLSSEQIIDRYNNLGLPIKEYLRGIFDSSLANHILKVATTRNIEDIAHSIKNLIFKVIGIMGIENAQIICGGIPTELINPRTLELSNNLYVCGEIIDIDGECGGYNLGWAWISGAICGINC